MVNYLVEDEVEVKVEGFLGSMWFDATVREADNELGTYTVKYKDDGKRETGVKGRRLKRKGHKQVLQVIMRRPDTGGANSSVDDTELTEEQLKNRQRSLMRRRARYLREKEINAASKEVGAQMKTEQKAARNVGLNRVRHVYGTFNDLPSEFMFW